MTNAVDQDIGAGSWDLKQKAWAGENFRILKPL